MTKLPGSWTRVEIGRICSLRNGKAFKPSDWGQTGLPIVRIQNLNNSNASYNFYSGDVDEKFLIEQGDLLFAWSGTPGTSFGAHIWTGSKAVLNQHIFRITFDDRVLNKKFFRHAIDQKLNELIQKAHGGVGLRHVTKGKFEETEIELPPRPEQDRIVEKLEELLSELDFSIDSLLKARAQMRVYRQALLGDAFRGKLSIAWQDANPDAVLRTGQVLRRIKEAREAHDRATNRKGRRARPLKDYKRLTDEVLNDLPPLPDGWLWEKLGWMTCGVEYGSGTKSSETGSVPVLRMGNIQNGKFDWSDLVYTSDPEEIAKYALRKGDVLFNRTNSPELVGKTAIYRGERPAVFAGYLIRVNHIPSLVDSDYLALFLNSRLARRFGGSVKTDGVNQSNINGVKLSNYPFPYCSIDEQREVVRLLEERLSIVERMEGDVEVGLLKAEALRQSILKKAFSGRLVSQHSQDETASALLERVQSEPFDGESLIKKETKRKVA